ncbi:M23 family metallopeptidase [Leptospira fletcheri]|uniref:M23 family metallopeptidase n=1 Tax=Leptospira fletcheri TaxID=2484981 RepID=A0A4R9GFX1_9LEPT|nr:M23 family metallopeptidase [Leptospira fletcheri]TGK11528.1 M23 family metallopeptidase [Leptospira fletcheri]
MRNGILLLLFLTFVYSVAGDPVESCDSKQVCYSIEPGNSDGSIFLRAKWLPPEAYFTVYLTVSGENTVTNPKTPLSVVLQGPEHKKATDLIKIDPTLGFSPHVSMVSYYGKLHAIHDDTYVYRLPYEGKTWVSVGYNSGNEHRGDAAQSIDFQMPEGTPILAARDGTVVETEEKFEEGRIDPILIDKANRVIIAHSDGTVAIYGHLKKSGVSVSVGQKVIAGTRIGFSGNTGYTSGPHLHFEVYAPEENRRKKSFATLFKTESGEAEFLTEENAYWYPDDQRFPGFPITDLGLLCISSTRPQTDSNSECLNKVPVQKDFYLSMPIYKSGPYEFEAKLFRSGEKKPILEFLDKIPAGVTSVSWNFPPITIKGKYTLRIRLGEKEIGEKTFQILP